MTSLLYRTLAAALTGAGLLCSGHAFAGAKTSKGLIALTQDIDYIEDIPFSVVLSVGGGYDRIDYSSLGIEDAESTFTQGTIGLRYGTDGRVTKWNVGLDFGAIYYFDSVEREENLFYNARLSFNVSHEVSRRLTVSNNLYVTYEIEPDYGIGVTTGRRAGQYLYGYNNTSLAYAWSRRLTTTTNYTIDGIKYVDDDLVADLENRLTQTISQQVSYALSRRTALTAEYRFRYANYYNTPETLGGNRYVNPDYTSHYVLLGIDQAWNSRLTASARAGAEFYSSDRTHQVSPYFEGSLNYALSRQAQLRWYAQVGYDGSELGLYDSRYAYRTGVILSRQFTKRFQGQLSAHYVHSEFEGNDVISSSSDDEINASVGFVYNFWRNLSFDAHYSYTAISSDEEFRDYDRHRVSVGMNAAF